MKISTGDRDPDLAKHAQGAPASGVSVQDDDGNFVAANVEEALAELADVLAGSSGSAVDRALDGTAVSRGNPPPWEPGSGSFTPDGSPVTLVDDSSHNAFPGLAWLDGEGTVGGRVLHVFRRGTDHLAGGDIYGMIGTVTDDDPWTFSWGSLFLIYSDATEDVRCADAVSIVDGQVVVTAMLYDGSANHDPFLLICDDAPADLTSSSTWSTVSVPLTSYPLNNLLNGRVLKLANGTYAVGFVGWNTGPAREVGILLSSSLTDWSAMSTVVIGTGAAQHGEIIIERLADNSLRAHLRGVTATAHYVSRSYNHGVTWTAPSSMFSASGLPMFRESPATGLMLTVYRKAPHDDTAWKESLDGGLTWTAQTVLDATGHHSAYATLLQLDDLHWLCAYAVEYSVDGLTGGADIFSQIFTDDSIPGWNQAEPNVNDGDDATYEEIDGADVLIIDLGAEYRITSTRLLIGTETAGAKTYVITGSVDPDFDPDLSEVLATLNFTATGSFTADEVTASWDPGVMYRYFKLTGDDENRRIFTWELLQEPFTLGLSHGDLSGLGDDDHPQYATDAAVAAALAALKLDDLAAPDDNTDLNATTSAHGLLPKLGGGTTNYLRADGTWNQPPGTGGGGSASDYIMIRDEKTQNTAGGTFTSGDWRTRDLNTEAADSGGHASIASNQITLAAGTYRATISCPAYRTFTHQARLQNITDAATILVGTSEYSDDGTQDPTATRSIIQGRFTLADTKVLEVQHRCGTTKADNGLGVANNFTTEVFTVVELVREPD